jgi:hypothetical protein
LDSAGLKAAGLAMLALKLFSVVRKVGDNGFDWLRTPKSACGALIPSSALPGRLKNV